MTNKQFVCAVYRKAHCLGIMYAGYIIHNGYHYPHSKELSERWAQTPKEAWKRARERLDQKLLDMAENKDKTWD